MTKSIFRNRRNRKANPEELRQQQQPFFNKTSLYGKEGSGRTPFFQAKLAINPPGDKYEREADAMSGTVISKAARPAAQNHIDNGQPGKKNGTVQCNGGNAAATTAPPALSAQIDQSTGKGKPLPAPVRTDMQSSFETDFSNVAIHTDAEAVQMNKELGARAFTYGSNIYFNSGEYNTDTTSGRQLLAHELTHVVQQSGEETGDPDISRLQDPAIQGDWQIGTLFPEENPPTEGCHVLLGGRRIDHWSGTFLGFRHLYIDYYKNSTDYGVIEGGPVPNSATMGGGHSGAWVKPSTWESRGIQWEITPTDCPSFIDCLKAQTASYHGAGHPYHATRGPNSNSFVYSVLNSCGVNVAFLLSSWPYLQYDYWATHSTAPSTPPAAVPATP